MYTMTKTLPLEDRIDQEVFAGIGLAIVMWSAIERVMGLYVMELLRSKKYSSDDEVAAFLVTTGMDVRTLIGLLRSLVKLRFPSHRTEFDKIADALDNAYTKRRNILAHRAFAAGKSPDRIKVYDIFVSKIEAHTRELTAKEIRSWATDFFELCIRLQDFFAARGLKRS
jgi:hypothetical protein